MLLSMMIQLLPHSTLFPYTTLFRSGIGFAPGKGSKTPNDTEVDQKIYRTAVEAARRKFSPEFMNRIDKVVVFRDRKSTRLNSSYLVISYAVFCLKKKKKRTK